MRSIWINKNYIAKIASTVTGGIYAFLGFIGMLVPLDEILSDKMSIWVRSIISISVLTGIWCCCFIIVSALSAPIHRRTIGFASRLAAGHSRAVDAFMNYYKSNTEVIF